jgi:hypothetical protein
VEVDLPPELSSLKDIVEIDKMPEQTNSVSKFLKLLWLIPILVLGYIGWVNLLPLGGTTTYFIDVGGQDTEDNAWVSGPFDRISDEKETDGTTYREIEKDLVYFELDDRRLDFTEEVEVRVKFDDNFPEYGEFMLGAKNKQEWSYDWKDVYISFYSQLADFPVVAENEKTSVYATGEKSEFGFSSVDDFLSDPPVGSVIAINDKNVGVNQAIGLEECELLDINWPETENRLDSVARDTRVSRQLWTFPSLRGGHSFYFYATSGILELLVAKQDLNWYEGEDVLEIEVCSMDEVFKDSKSIPDDGDINASKKLGKPQYTSLRVDGLSPGPYRLVLRGAGGDFLITQLVLNQTGLVVGDKVFLAGGLYTGEELQAMNLWFYHPEKAEIRFWVVHNSALQNVRISGESWSDVISIDTTHEWFSTGLLDPGVYQITLEKGDVVIEASGGYFAATEGSLFLPVSSQNHYDDDNLLVNTALRGAHTLWTYVNNGLLSLEITKQDLNWYENPDELIIEVYSLDNELKGSAIIPDDGNESDSKELGSLQTTLLTTDNLKPGSYRIELKGGGDLLIRRIEINQEKLVVEKKLFPVGMNIAYFKEGLGFDSVNLYGYSFKPGEIRFITYDNSGLQNVYIQQEGSIDEIEVSETREWFGKNLKPRSYQLVIPRQDITIESGGYFSFTPDSFFLPKRCEVVDLKYELSWVKENADYIIVNYEDYIPPVEDDGWLIAQAKWKKEDLFIKDNKLNFCLNAPHLDKEPEKTIPIDWIEIMVKVPPIWERLGWVR